MERDTRMVQNELETFVEEFIDVLKYHASIHPSERSDFQIYDFARSSEDKRYFTQTVQKAVFTLAYIFRVRCLRAYSDNCHYFKFESPNYRRFLMMHPIPADRYFLRFLTWISFVFEMTMCCCKQECEAAVGFQGPAHVVKPPLFIDESKRCLENYPNIRILRDRKRETEWWEEIQKCANHIAAFHDILVEALERQNPGKDILRPFQAVLKSILKLNEYKLRMTEIITFRDYPMKKYHRSTKLRHLLKCDLDRIALGHTVVRPKQSAYESWLSSKQSSKKLKRAPSHEKLEQMMYGQSTSADTCTADTFRSNVSDYEEYFKVNSYRNTSFVIRESKLERIFEGVNPYKQDIEIYFPRKEIIRKVENLYNVLEENIKGKKFHFLGIQLVLVNLQDPYHHKDDRNPVILMDSSSEEEDDDEFDPRERTFVDDMLRKWKEFCLDDVEMMSFVLRSPLWES